MERSAINENFLIRGTNALGLALRDGFGKPLASVSMAGPSSVLATERFAETRVLLQSGVEDLKESVPNSQAE